jgi:deazaflavin-dependent oxidoreductase (nitroreductase family)
MVANGAGDVADEFNAAVIEEFRANAGQVGGQLAGTALVLVHHIGARSGVVRVVPLAYSPRGDGRYAIVATNGGSPAHPAWYYNLKAHPRITIEVGTRKFTARAEELDDTARAELWPKLVAESPAIGEFQNRTTRKIPVFLVIRQDRADGPGDLTAPRRAAY